jgi:hypothetical protein
MEPYSQKCESPAGMPYHTVTWMTKLAVLSALLLLAGCSGPKDRKAAAEAVNKSLKRDAVQLLVFIGRVSEKCAPINLDENQDLSTRPEYHAAQKAGLISITPDGPGFWKVDLLNPKPAVIENLKKVQHNVKDGCDDLYFGFTVASKTADIVSLHKVTDEEAEAEFTWKWKLEPAGVKLVDGLSQQERYQVTPCLEVVSRRGKRDPSFNLGTMDQSSTPQSGKVALKKSGDGWVVDE